MKNHCLAPLMRTFFRRWLHSSSFSSYSQRRTADADRPPRALHAHAQPDLKAATFTGIETIDVNLAEPADRITLTPRTRLEERDRDRRR